jgi:hypothetical protein
LSQPALYISKEENFSSSSYKYKLKTERNLKLSEGEILRTLFGAEIDELRGGCRKLHKRGFVNLYPLSVRGRRLLEKLVCAQGAKKFVAFHRTLSFITVCRQSLS